MVIRFRCECGRALKASETHAGRHAKCPACGKDLQIPSGKTVDALHTAEPEMNTLEAYAGSPARFVKQRVVTHKDRAICNQSLQKSFRDTPRTKKLVFSLTVTTILVGVISLAAYFFFFYPNASSKGLTNVPSHKSSPRKAEQVLEEPLEEVPPGEVSSTNSAVSTQEPPPKESISQVPRAKLPVPDTGEPAVVKSTFKQEADISLRPLGFVITESIPAYEFAGQYTPWKLKTSDTRFLLVVLSIRSDRFLPTDEVYQKIKDERETKGLSISPRDRCLVYDPTRFRLILLDGRTYPGEMIGKWESGSSVLSASTDGFGRRVIFEGHYIPIDPNNTETVAVAWVLDSKDCGPPIRIVFGNDAPVAVPDNEFPAPRGKLVPNLKRQRPGSTRQ